MSPISISNDNGKNTGPMQTVLMAAATGGTRQGIAEKLPLRQGTGDHQPEDVQKADCWQCLDLHVAASGEGRADQFLLQCMGT